MIVTKQKQKQKTKTKTKTKERETMVKIICNEFERWAVDEVLRSEKESGRYDDFENIVCALDDSVNMFDVYYVRIGCVRVTEDGSLMSRMDEYVIEIDDGNVVVDRKVSRLDIL